MSYIGDIARSICKTVAGENASITKAFSREAMSNLSYSAVKADIDSASRKLIANAMDNKIITREAFEQVSKADDFNIIDYARNIAKKDGGNEAYKKSLADFKKKSMAFEEVYNNNMTEAEYFGRKANEGIGLKNTAKGYFLDPTYGKTRTKATLGAGAAAAVGVRYLSGGNLTTNAQGERDIAGIPFI